jgi:hypothetical protein
MQTDFIMRLEFFRCEPKLLELLQEPRPEGWENKIYSLFNDMADPDELHIYFKDSKDFGQITDYVLDALPACEDVIIFTYSCDDYLRFTIGEHDFVDIVGEHNLLGLAEKTKELFEAELDFLGLGIPLEVREKKLRSVFFYTHWEAVFLEEDIRWNFKGIIDMSELKYM